ncbi:hypothetical protein ACFL59_14660 [Planctomycetota bacterium]
MDLSTLWNTPPWDRPEQTGKFVLGVLRDQLASEEDRSLAAELAGEYTVVNDELAEALLTIVGSTTESEELRCRAAIALGPALEHSSTEGFEDAEEQLISEELFRRLVESLRKLFFDAGAPEGVRRKILEVSVRAPQDWHQEAVRTAYASNDEAWRLTAVFCMRFVRGFDEQILRTLRSEDPEMRYQAVCAAGNWEVAGAWSHVAQIATSGQSDKRLRLAAIDAVASIRPGEASETLNGLSESDDEDIIGAVFEALALAEGHSESQWDAEAQRPEWN